MPIHGKEIISTKPRPKSAYDFFAWVYCFIVWWCICLDSWRYLYSPFVLKVPLFCSAIEASMLQARARGTVYRSTCDGTWTMRVSNVNWKHFYLGV